MSKDKQPNEALRYQRSLRGWSQQKVADEIGASNEMVSNWERGKKKTSSFYQEKLCNLFGKNAEELGFLLPVSADPSREAPAQRTPNRVASFFQEGGSQQESLFFPDRPVLLWTPHNPKIYPCFAGWPTLPQERSEALAKEQEIAYVPLEVETLVTALQWKRSSDPIVLLQQLTYDSIRKHDAMHKDHSDHTTGITRRHALQAIATFPIQMYSLTHLVSEARPLPLNELLPFCAAGITACWELRRYESDGLPTIQRILSAYLPTLENVVRQSSSFQSTAACLASQGYLLVNVLAEHYGKMDQMEIATRQARFYGKIAQDVKS